MGPFKQRLKVYIIGFLPLLLYFFVQKLTISNILLGALLYTSIILIRELQLAYIQYKKKKNLTLEIHTVDAMVWHKEIKREGPRGYSQMIYIIYFFIAEQECNRELRVSSEIFYSVEKGVHGTLVYQGNTCLSFTSDT